MTADATAMNGWGADSEFGRLEDVLLGPASHYRWLSTSAISDATLASGAVFDEQAAVSQHAELVDALQGAGARCHFLEPDPALPYQVFARDSSLMTPFGAVITQLHQPWRRGEYAAATQFYGAQEIPIWRRLTAGPLEGGDFMFLDPSRVLIGACEARTTYKGAEQLAEWLEAEGIEVHIEAIPQRYVHMDVLCCVVAAGLVAVCADVVSMGLIRWLKQCGFELVEVRSDDAMQLGVNILSLGGDRVVSGASASKLNEQLRANGLEVLDPNLDSFTRGGGGAHCLTQALRREGVG